MIEEKINKAINEIWNDGDIYIPPLLPICIIIVLILLPLEKLFKKILSRKN